MVNIPFGAIGPYSWEQWVWLLGTKHEEVTPSAPSPTPTQQSLPTSKYGTTIPVVFGRARLAGGYIWSPGFETGSNEGELQKTLTARLRFGASLVDNAVWGVRRIWADGTLVYNAATGYRMSGLTFTTYYGHSSQERDARMVEIEGEENVSAHRGYLDIVVEDYPIETRNPPVFEAEWVQTDVLTYDDDAFTDFNSEFAQTYPMLIGSGDTFYSISNGAGTKYLKKYSISGLQEISAVPIADSAASITKECRYIRQFDRIIVTYVPDDLTPVMINPHTGAVVATANAPGGFGFMQTSLAVMFGSTLGVYLNSSWSGGELASFKITPESITHMSTSGTSWDGRGDVHTMAIGVIGISTATVYVGVEDTIVYKMTVHSTGAISGITPLVTLGSDCQYLIYRGGYIYAWDNAQQMLKISPAGTIVRTDSLPYQISSTFNAKRIPPGDMQVITNTVFVSLFDGSNYYITNLDTGDTVTYADLHTGNPYQTWDGRRKLLLSANVGLGGGTTFRTLFDVPGDGAPHDLEDFIEALFVARGNFHPSEIEIIGVNDVILGAIIATTRGRRDIERTVNDPYRIGMFERAGNIICKRANTDASFAVDAAITSSDIVDRGGRAISARRLNPEESIARYGISYRDPDEVYQTKTQFGEIPATPLPVAPVDNAVSSDIPIIIQADTVKVLATKYVNKRAVEKHEFTMTLRAKFFDLEPEDIITFSFANRTITARVRATTMNPDFTIDVRATEFLSKTDVTIAGAVGRPITPTEVGDPESIYVHLDIPLLSDGHDLAGDGFVQYHMLASAGQADWDGATLYRAAGSTYSPVSSQVVDGLVGLALDVLPDWDIPYVTEFTRTLQVSFGARDTSSLASATYQEVCEGANMFAIGAPGRWEVCHVMTITDEGDGVFTFEGLRRGRGVSEEHTGDHAEGDYVVWLAGTNVDRLTYAIAELDDAFNYKPVGSGGLLSTTPAESHTIPGEAEKIPKPCHLEAAIGSPSDVRLSWVRRSRIGSYWAEDGDDTYTTPLGESLEQYVVRIKDGPGGTIKRTITVDDQTFHDYPGDQQIADFGGALASGDDLTYDIRQVSGTGVICPAREETITL